ncbi:hypothetical protein NHJ13734_005529 [Beauveria thailandica]
MPPSSELLDLFSPPSSDAPGVARNTTLHGESGPLLETWSVAKPQCSPVCME